MLSKFHLPQTRWGAFAGHLLISLFIFILLALLIVCLLFPGALFSIAGGIDGIKIVAGVDLVLGPLLTLIIYNIAKPRKELYRDLAVIGTVQFAALFAGMYLVYHNRPAVVVYAYDTFYTVKSSEYDVAKKAKPESPSWLTPGYYYLQLPEDNQEAMRQLVDDAVAGEQSRLQTNLYRPFPDDSSAQQRVLRVGTLANDQSTDECLLRKLESHYRTKYLCFDAANQKFSLPEKSL